jgi:hypothetical protein
MKTTAKLILWTVSAIAAAGVLFAAGRCVGWSLVNGSLTVNNCEYNAVQKKCTGSCSRWTATIGHPTCAWCYDYAAWAQCPDCTLSQEYSVVLVNADTADCKVSTPYGGGCDCVNWRPANPPQEVWYCHPSAAGIWCIM